MLKKGVVCPVCGEGKISEQTVTERFEYKGNKISISNYHIFRCERCREKIVSPKTLRETEKALTDFRRNIDGLLTSDENRAIREKLGKTQTEMARLLGVGEKNFARYENGQVTQSKSMDLLLRIIDVDPQILHQIEAKRMTPKLDYEGIGSSTACFEKEQDIYTQKSESTLNKEIQYAA